MRPVNARFTSLQAIALLIMLVLACSGILLALIGNLSFDLQQGIPQYSPILVVVEVFLYLLGALLFFSSIDLLTAFCLSLLLAALRAVAGLAAAALVHELFAGLTMTLRDGESYEMWQLFANLYLGNPAFTMVQVLLVAGAFLPFAGYAMPGLLGLKGREDESTESDQASESQADVSRKSQINLPVGGFVQCYSYEDLRNTVRKVPNLLGYALSTSEGLLVFGDGRRLALPLESTVPRFQVGSSIIHQYQQRSGLPGTELWQFGEDQALVMMTISPCFFLLLFFKPDIDLKEIEPRIRSVRLSGENFLTDRHRPLLLAAEEEGEAI